MATLSGQTIQSTYQGLLKLANSTTGVTSTYQAIEDGLGNNTGSRISTGGILAPNLPSLNGLKPDFGGAGYVTGAGSINVANTQNRTLYTIFYDTGLFAYSAMTYNLGTLTSTSDVVTAALYSLQLVPGIGIAPKDLLMSGMTLTSAGSTGVKTTALPSTLSFSGTGGGYYILAFYVANAGVTPTVRYTNGNLVTNNQGYATSLGLFSNAAGTATLIGSKYIAIGNTMGVINLPFQSTYSVADINTNFVTSITTQPAWSVALNTIF